MNNDSGIIVLEYKYSSTYCYCMNDYNRNMIVLVPIYNNSDNKYYEKKSYISAY